MAFQGRLGSEFSVAEAVGLYRRLRERGQSSVLARLSVEARCGKLTQEQRRLVNQLLRAHEDRPF